MLYQFCKFPNTTRADSVPLFECKRMVSWFKFNVRCHADVPRMHSRLQKQCVWIDLYPRRQPPKVWGFLNPFGVIAEILLTHEITVAE
jgi:hypothetical protein